MSCIPSKENKICGVSSAAVHPHQSELSTASLYIYYPLTMTSVIFITQTVPNQQ